jgi:hypothetical protein
LRQPAHNGVRADEHRCARQRRALELSSCYRIYILHRVAIRLKIDVDEFWTLPEENVDHYRQRHTTIPKTPLSAKRNSSGASSRDPPRKFQQLRRPTKRSLHHPTNNRLKK